jgi:hypothetical protein
MVQKMVLYVNPAVKTAKSLNGFAGPCSCRRQAPEFQATVI